MSATDQMSRLTPYLERLLRDEYIHEQLGDAVTGLRRSSQRAKGRGAAEALKDRRLRNQLSAAARSLNAVGRALSQPEPPKRHWFRRALLLAAAGGGAALAWQRMTGDSPHPDA
jgi:hypothetical protein